jgi:hypothetical protein
MHAKLSEVSFFPPPLVSLWLAGRIFCTKVAPLSFMENTFQRPPPQVHHLEGAGSEKLFLQINTCFIVSDKGR